MWFLALLSVLVGALATSSILFRTVNLPSLLPPGAHPPLPAFVQMVPILWITLLGAFGYLAYREVRSTDRGYRYALPVLLLALVIASLVLGIGFYASGAGFVLDRFAAKHVPFHEDLEQVQHERWMSPKTGFLVGMVETVGTSSFTIRTNKDEIWIVQLASSTQPDDLDTDSRTGVRGRIVDSEARVFLACDVRSLEFEGTHFMTPPKGMGRKHPPTRSTNCEDVRPSGY